MQITQEFDGRDFREVDAGKDCEARDTVTNLMERILAHDELEARPTPSSPDQQKPTPPEPEHPNPTASLDFLWLAAPPLSMGSPPIVPAAAHTQVPPVSSICNHGHHFLLEVYCHPLVLPFGAQTWSLQPQQPPTKFGTPPHLANQGMMAISPAMGQNGASLAGQPKMDSKSVPSPTQTSESIYHETRLNNQANPPPVVDFGESGPVRCSRCKGYINPFMKFIDHGRRFICNFCGFADETPSDYQCNLGPDGRRRDADERPELCRGTVKFVASKEYIHGQLSKRDF
ncbi:Protein transport protein [Salix suchowensis]|nr:Protein transport protein [Salix suchowensis]